MRRGAPESCTGLILRTIKLGDTSKIVSALSLEHGRIRLVAKGARQLQSRWFAALEPGSEVELLVYVRPGRDLWTMGDAQLLRGALTANRGLPELIHLFAALELAERLLPEQEPQPGVFSLYRQFVARWHELSAEAMPALFFALELALAEDLGVALDVTCCADCAVPLVNKERAVFIANDGVFRCANCAGPFGRWLDASTLRLLGGLASGFDTFPTSAMAEHESSSIGRVLHEHLQFHLPNYRVPRSLYWLRPKEASA